MSTLATTNIKHPSGASNNIVLDASGNVNIDSNTLYVDATNNRVGIGTTSPASKCEISDAASTTGQLRVSATGIGALFAGVASSTLSYLQANTGALAFGTGTNNFLEERARIDSSGRLLVGTSTTSAVASAVVQGSSGGTTAPAAFYLARGSTPADGNSLGDLIFSDNGHGVAAFLGAYRDGGTWTSGSSQPTRLVFSTTADGASSPTERMRIGNDGSVGIGTSNSSTIRLQVNATANNSANWSLIANNASGANALGVRGDGALYCGLLANSPFNITTATAANATLLGDGYLYRSTSSLKYKKNVKDADYGLTDLLKLRAVTYQGTSSADGNNVFGGLIAEEVDAAGLSVFVQYAEDGSPDALAYSNMVSLCIKAIQEQQAMITKLEAKIAALETQ